MEQPTKESENPETNKEETVEKPEGEEEALTFAEIMEELEKRDETAKILLGGQDDTVCTYAEGYRPRQAVFACLTCTPSESSPAGICYGCSVNCHVEHEIVELYTKRKFKCDCGNSNFNDKKCTLYADKDTKNEFNSYNHNFHGLFCVCNDTYPSEKTQEDMIQCTICEDWFHLSHLNLKDPDAENVTSTTTSLVCSHCTQNLPFLHNLNTKDTEKVCVSSKSVENNEATSLLIEDLRGRLCNCQECKKVYEKYDCEYLLDDEDDLGKFEEENVKKANEDKQTEPEAMRQLVGEVGMEGAIQCFGAINDLKRKLTNFFQPVNFEDGVVKAEDVKKFFDNLKEEQLEAKRAKLG